MKSNRLPAWGRMAIAGTLLLALADASAYDGQVEKKIFTLPWRATFQRWNGA